MRVPQNRRRLAISLLVLLVCLQSSPAWSDGASDASKQSPNTEVTSDTGAAGFFSRLWETHPVSYALIVTFGMALLAAGISTITEFILRRLRPGGLS